MILVILTAPNSSGISFQCQFQSLKTLTIEACPKLASLPPLPTLSDMIVGASNETILSSLASFTSLSSLLINDMELGVSNFLDLTLLGSLKKLILCNVKDKLIGNILYVGKTFTALQHFSILHCHQLTDLSLFYFSSLQKLHVIDCPNLYRILVRKEKKTPLVELVVEDCPKVISSVCFGKFPALRKLIVKNCGRDFTIFYAGNYKKLEKLDYLFITGCSRMELELKKSPSLISHVPCIIVGDQKVNYEELKDLIVVPTRALLHQRSNSTDDTKKLVMKVSINCRKCKTGVMKTAAKFTGVTEVKLDVEKEILTVIGTFDPVYMVSKLRKAGYIVVEIMSVGPSKKPSEKDKEPDKSPWKPLPPFCNQCQLNGVIYVSDDHASCSIL